MRQSVHEEHPEAGRSDMSRYPIVVERGPTSYGAYVPDLPGCVAVGQSADEVRGLIEGAILMHVAELRRQGLPIPPPTTEPSSAESA
jgi:predicted RNase H-like HicB family nuclease